MSEITERSELSSTKYKQTENLFLPPNHNNGGAALSTEVPVRIWYGNLVPRICGKKQTGLQLEFLIQFCWNSPITRLDVVFSPTKSARFGMGLKNVTQLWLPTAAPGFVICNKHFEPIGGFWSVRSVDLFAGVLVCFVSERAETSSLGGGGIQILTLKYDIYSCDFGGSGRCVVLHDQFVRPIAMTLNEQHVWTLEFGFFSCIRQAVCPKETCGHLRRRSSWRQNVRTLKRRQRPKIVACSTGRIALETHGYCCRCVRAKESETMCCFFFDCSNLNLRSPFHHEKVWEHAIGGTVTLFFLCFICCWFLRLLWSFGTVWKWNETIPKVTWNADMSITKE